MTTKTDDIKLPNLPLGCVDYPAHFPSGAKVMLVEAAEVYARTAIETDRQRRIQSDDELRATWRTAGGTFYGPNVESGKPYAYFWMSDDGERIRYWTRDPAQAARQEARFCRPPMRLFNVAAPVAQEPSRRPYGTETMSEYGIIPECDSVPTPPAVEQPSAQDREDAERYRYLRGRNDASAGVGCWLEADGAPIDRGWLNGDQLDRAIDAARAEKEE